MGSINNALFLLLTVVQLCNSGNLYDDSQKLHAIKLKPCSGPSYTACQDKGVIPQVSPKTSSKTTTGKLPGGYEVKSNGALTLVIDFVVQRIENIHPELNTLKIMGFPRMWWFDQRLAWNKTDQSNMVETHYDSSEVWVPDVIPVLGTGKTLVQTWARWKDVVQVRNDGLCRWSPKGTFEFITSLDLTKGPYEKQTVDLVWESWMQTENELQLEVRHTTVDVKNLFHNIGWNYESSKAYLSKCTAQNSVSCFPSLNFELEFKRQSTLSWKYVLKESRLFSAAGTNGLLAVIFIMFLFDSAFWLFKICYPNKCVHGDKKNNKD